MDESPIIIPAAGTPSTAPLSEVSPPSPASSAPPTFTHHGQGSGGRFRFLLVALLLVLLGGGLFTALALFSQNRDVRSRASNDDVKLILSAPASVKPGDSFTASVFINPNSKTVLATEVTMKYSSNLELTQVTPGEFFTTGFSPSQDSILCQVAIKESYDIVSDTSYCTKKSLDTFNQVVVTLGTHCTTGSCYMPTGNKSLFVMTFTAKSVGNATIEYVTNSGSNVNQQKPIIAAKEFAQGSPVNVLDFSSLHTSQIVISNTSGTNPPEITITPAPQDANPPHGYLDGAVSGAVCSVNGWSCDPDNYAAKMKVRLYEGDILRGETIANLTSEQGVTNACGGDANHRYNYVFPASNSIYDGVAHTMSAKAVGIDAQGNELAMSTLQVVSDLSPVITCTSAAASPTVTTTPEVTITPTIDPGAFPTPTPDPACPKVGDFNCDGKVDAFDLSIWIQSYGFSKGEEGYNAHADPVQYPPSTNKIDALDFMPWYENYEVE